MFFFLDRVNQCVAYTQIFSLEKIKRVIRLKAILINMWSIHDKKKYKTNELTLIRHACTYTDTTDLVCKRQVVDICNVRDHGYRNEGNEGK